MMVNVNEALNINLFFFYQLEKRLSHHLFPDPHTKTLQEIKVFTLKGLVGGVFLRV